MLRQRKARRRRSAARGDRAGAIGRPRRCLADASAGDGLELRGTLRRHGIAPVLHRDRSAASDAGERLARCAVEFGAGLLVIGGNGHGRTRERVLGGATAFMLRAAPLPVRMGH